VTGVFFSGKSDIERRSLFWGNIIASPADTAVVHFSSEDFPERERHAIWREVVGRQILHLEMEPLSIKNFLIDSTAYLLPGAVVGRHRGRSFRSTRTRNLLADGNDDVILSFLTAGRSFVSNRRGERGIGEGYVMLGSQTDTGTVTSVGAVRGEVITLKHKQLAALVPDLDDMFSKQIVQDSTPLRLLRAYLSGITAAPRPPDFEIRAMVASHLYELVAVAIGARPEVIEQARHGGIPAARLTAIKADIETSLDDAEISAEWVAGRHQISPTYVRRLFERDGTTLSEFVLGIRLARAHRLLVAPRFFHWTILAIAVEVGFDSLTYFNRTFRRCYGATPSEVRAAACREWARGEHGPHLKT